MLTSKTKYGLKALAVLAKRFPTGEVAQIADIAEAERIPVKFLESILVELKNKGLLRSKRGPGGGYSLARRPDQISVAEIVRLLNGPLAPVPCVSQTAYSPCEECPEPETCGIRLIMKEARDAIANVLERITLQDVADRIDGAGTKSEALMYYI